MIKANELTKNTIVEIDGVPHGIETIQIQTPSARGGSSIYKVRFRNMQTGQKLDKSLRSDDALQETQVETRKVQFLYKNGDHYTFMDQGDYTQFELGESEIEDTVPFLVDDLEDIVAVIFDGRVLTIRPPDNVELEITECDPSIKGATAAARTKPATLSTGLVVQVPEYISQGEKVRIDTRTSSFVCRA